MHSDPQEIMKFLYSLRRAGVMDRNVMEAMERIDRRRFVSQTFSNRAYEDTPLPIASGQTISQPSIVALMTEALQIGKRHKVLEIGTGSGYQAAILSQLARRVYTMERHQNLVQTAKERFEALGLTGITTLWGDGSLGYLAQAPFDRIMITAAAEDPPGPLLQQLAPGGIMVLPVGLSDHVQQLIRVRREAEGFHYEELREVRFVPLIDGVPRS